MVHRSLGLKKLQDATYGEGARWLVVAAADQADFGIVLQKPEPGLYGEERTRVLMDQIGKGTTWVFRADDLNATYETLKSKGVKFDSPPTRQAWGNRAMFEDPYGNRYALMGKQRSGE